MRNENTMSNFLENYEPVENRIRAFWEKFPNGRILTSIEFYPDSNRWVCKTEIYRDETGIVTATGHAEEVIGSSNVNRTSALENCETSSIGRALANLNFAPKGARPSLEEMQKADRTSGNTKPRNFVAGNDHSEATLAQQTAVENCAKAFARRINTPATPDFILGILTLATGRKIGAISELTKHEASDFINERKEEFAKLQPKFDDYMTKKGQGK